jgi:hypothetical protein
MPTSKPKNTMTSGGKRVSAGKSGGAYLPHQRPKSSGTMTSSSGKVVHARPKAKVSKGEAAIRKALKVIMGK